MTHFETMPIWAAIPVAVLVVFGAALTLIGAAGLWRLPSFYDRLHAPTLGTSWGTAGIVLASILMFSVVGGRAVIHESVIAVFIMVTTPVTLMLLGRAALHRDRVEGNIAFQFNREDELEAKAAQQLAQAEARANVIRAQEASLAAEKAALEPVEPVAAEPQPGLPSSDPSDNAKAEAELPDAVAPETHPQTKGLFPEPKLASEGAAATEPEAQPEASPAPAAEAPSSAEPEAQPDADEKKPSDLPEY